MSATKGDLLDDARQQASRLIADLESHKSDLSADKKFEAGKIPVEQVIVAAQRVLHAIEERSGVKSG